MRMEKNYIIMNRLRDLYCSPHVSCVHILGHVEGLGGTKIAYKTVTGKPENAELRETK
jgi:hypothetical protein